MKTMRTKTWLIVGCLLAAAWGDAQTGKPITLELTRDGQPTATIVLAEKPTRAAQFAAAELQEHVRKISGATLLMVGDTDKVEGLRILVGESKVTQALGLKNEDFKPQEYLIRFMPDTLVLMGRDKEDFEKLDYSNPDGKTIPDVFDDHATVYAVYDFLEIHCGVRWYLPTELGTVYDTAPTLKVTGSERRRMPWMECRVESLQDSASAVSGYRRFPNDLIGTVFFGAGGALPWREQVLFAHRLRLGGRRMALGGHSFYGYYPRFWGDSRYPQFFESRRPEFFAQGYKEDPPPQMCYTSPELVEQFATDARDFFNGKEQRHDNNEASTGQDYFVVGAMDNVSFCKCPRCSAIIKMDPAGPAGYDKQSINDYWFGFVNKVAREVKKTHPDKMLITLSYGLYNRPPSLEPLEPNVAIVQVLGSSRCAYNTPEYDTDMKCLDAWVKESQERQKYLWMHWLWPVSQATGANPAWYPFPGFFAHQVVEQMELYKKDGCRGMVIEVSSSDHKSYAQRLYLWDQLEMYVTWQLAIDPEKDGDQLIDEFFARYYGAAGKPMKAFYEMAEEIYGNPNNYPYGAASQTTKIAWECLGTGPRMEKLERFMDEARAACRTETEKKRVELFDKGIWQVMCAGRNAYLDYKTLADATMKSARAPLCSPPAEGDPRKVDWSKAGVLEGWSSFDGKPIARKVEGRIAHDGQRLYLRLQEQMDTGKIVRDGTSVFSGDDWEIFLARRSPDYTYRQMGVDVHGSHIEYFYSPTNFQSAWDSGAQVYSDAGAADCWNVYIALPLDKLLEGGTIQAGDTIYLNLVRATHGQLDGAALWIPTLVSSFHTPDRLGRIVLEKDAK